MELFACFKKRSMALNASSCLLFSFFSIEASAWKVKQTLKVMIIIPTLNISIKCNQCYMAALAIK